MSNNTIQYTVRNNLCCGCGVCKGVCPKDCISWEKINGLYVPQINEALCVNCGLCALVCPGLGHIYEAKETAEETVTGTVRVCYNAWSEDATLRHVSASGGVVSTMIRKLLLSGQYDGAFCLDSYDYSERLKTRLCIPDEVKGEWSSSNAPKSRYLPVSHENAVAYMKANRDSRLILVGTSCAVRGLQAAIKQLRLKRDNYLFIGLFCDKVFNYNVIAYFEDKYAEGNKLKALHFKNKESGGWPGDMKLFPERGEPFYVPLSERGKAKAYFMPERCLYCVDKLNACADISIGDNYTGKDESELGSNSVIIRTEAGEQDWRMIAEEIEMRDIHIEDIQKAQATDWRLNNLYFGDLSCSRTDLNPGVPREKKAAGFRNSWKTELKKLRAGAVYDANPEKLRLQIIKDNKKPNPITRFVRRVVGFVLRRLRKTV